MLTLPRLPGYGGQGTPDRRQDGQGEGQRAQPSWRRQGRRPQSYAWQNDYCFPGQARLGMDLGIDERNVRRHLKSLEAHGLLAIQRRGQGKTNIYELNLKPKLLSQPIQTGRKRPV
jgi:biotin operon repressor